MAVAVKHNLYILSDEMYEHLVYDGAQPTCVATLSPEALARTIVVAGFSKTYAMTGWRAGYCAAPKKLIDAMFLVLAQSSRGPATFIQDAAAAAPRTVAR